MKRIAIFLAAAFVIAACGNNARKGPDVPVDDLRAGFQNPPQAARPQVWWHWMNGNITRDGIRKDLEWMHRIGIGGVHHFDAGTAVTPQIVDNRLVYMHDDWKDAFRYAICLADSLGMPVTIASSPGWSATGGPWVEPEDAMKKLVWRTATVKGGSRVECLLPEPFRSTGTFQDNTLVGANPLSGTNYTGPEYYEDIAVMAVKVPDGQKDMKDCSPLVTSSEGHFSVDMLTDGALGTCAFLPGSTEKKTQWIQYSFPEPVTVKSVSLGIGGDAVAFSSAHGSRFSLESSEDGNTFSKVCDLSAGPAYVNTVSIPETTARHFRIVAPLLSTEPDPLAAFLGIGPHKGDEIAEFILWPYTRVNRAEDKAGFSAEAHLANAPTPASAGEAYAGSAAVVDLTGRIDAKGKLSWDAPEGTWRIYRIGASLTGKQNHPAPAEATGLEVDKLSREAMGKYIRAYLDMYKEASGGLLGSNGIQYLLTDSYEAGIENWTSAMFEEFRTRRGYDLHPWLPALFGEVLDSPAATDAFLHDWRETLSELVAENYAQISDILRNEYGMAGGYFEGHEGTRAYVMDGIQGKKTAAVPMGAMWSSMAGTKYESDDRESSSVAHLYGQNIAAAESFTDAGNIMGSAYSYSPAKLKSVADYEMSAGINRFVIHESAHQPDDTHVPGLSLMGTGQWFNRHETWAEMAGVWIGYLSRSCYLLQAGRNVADILFYYGEDSDVSSEFAETPDGVPSGWQRDYCNPDALLNDIRVENGMLVSPGGTSYRLLWMDRNVEYMSLKVLRRIAEIAKAGVPVGGVRPLHPSSLADDPAEFEALVKDIWDNGRSNVYETRNLKECLNKAGIAPDAVLPEGFRYLHRDAGSTQVYWVNKPQQDNRNVTVSFRVSGLKPEVWHPDSGKMEEVSYRVKDGRTEVEIDMVPEDAVFVVFAGKGEDSFSAPVKVEADLLNVERPWSVEFQEGRGAPEEVAFSALSSFTESKEPGIRYFSGIATYRNSFIFDGEVPASAVLDLGQVNDIAEVYVNGTLCGTAWKAPYRVDVSEPLRRGENMLEIRVANPWANRIIGDQQPETREKVTWTDMRYYFPTSPLRSAGLLGPVKLSTTATHR